MISTDTAPRRILVIDDNPAIHDDFRKVLCPEAMPTSQLKSAAATLFGRVASSAFSPVNYAIDVVSRGQDGFEKVQLSLEDETPYSLAFIDMRMPNGWNGIETIQRIWEICPMLQVVLCTAYSDFSWSEIREELPQSDRFLILKKPFDNIEVQQLAETLTGRCLAESALRDKERILSEAQHIARIGHYSADLKSGAWTGSAILGDIFGVEMSFSRDFNQWLGLIDAPYRQPLLDRIENAASTHNGFEQVCRLSRCMDGQLRWLLARGRWERDARGSATRLIGTFQDFTEAFQSQQHLRLLETCVAQMNDAVVITDAEDLGGGGPHIIFVNDAFVRDTGYTSEEVIGRSPRFLQGPGTQRAELDRIRRAILRGEPVRAELTNYGKDGREWWIDLDIVPVKDKTGQCTNFVSVQRNISQQKLASAHIERLAYRDSLTGLANRRLLIDRLEQTLAASARVPAFCGLLFLDLDNFKEINDSFGHDRGDLLLGEVANRLLRCVREEDTIARFGGDEFAVLLRNLGSDRTTALANAETAARKITTALACHYLLGETTYRTTVSVGVALSGLESMTVEDMLRQADIAMYQAKSAGKNTYRFFDTSMQLIVDERVQLSNDLRLAIESHQFELHYQPQFNTERGLVGAEALLRWDAPGRGPVSPGVFVPLAEQIWLIRPLGNWVLDTACRELARWAGIPCMAHLTMSVNVSSQQFQMPDFVDSVLASLTSSGARAERLKLELTESMLIHDLADVDRKMTRLKSHGVGLSLDDFGTGYSSLSYLKRLSLDQLKIDQSFVRDVMTDANDAAIARTIVALGQSLGLEVIAEGVETQAHKDFLISIGCNAFQGYFFSRPLAAPVFERFVCDGSPGA